MIMLAAGPDAGFLMFQFVADELAFIAMAVFSVFVLFRSRRTPGRCPRCGERNREPALFCAQCGLRLPGR